MPEPSVYALNVRTLEGDPFTLDDFVGDVAVFVNVASECGYTPQYAGLQRLHESLVDSGVRVVGVPSNDFGGQEPGTAEQIATFCTENYDVTFPLLEKQGTKAGDSALFDVLAELTGKRPAWNFCKYVVSRDGREARFFASAAVPGGAEIAAVIEEFRAH